MLNQTELIKKDRMRFTKNSLSSSLALLAIVVNVLYFVSIYKSNFTYYYTWQIGISVLANLIFMLAVFLSSEGVKNYKMGYSIALMVIGVIQIVRIFIIPVAAHAATINVVGGGTAPVMDDAQFARVIIYLCVSSALLIAAGIIGAIRSKTLSDYKKTIEEIPA